MMYLKRPLAEAASGAVGVASSTHQLARQTNLTLTLTLTIIRLPVVFFRYNVVYK